MKILKKHDFGEVTGWELGWSPVGRPMMTVFFFIVKDLMIDTGLRHMRQEIKDIVCQNHIRNILLTHYHEDHSGNAAIISKATGAGVYGHPLTAKKLHTGYRIFPYQHLMWGKTDPVKVNPVADLWENQDIYLKPVHTPGHSPDHCCYYDRQNGRLFSGDLYLSARIKYFRADEHICQQITSLKKVLSLDFDALYCAHRPMPRHGRTAIAKKLQYLENFYGRVADLARQGMNERAIMASLKLKEQYLIKWMCFGNVSMKNMVRSVIDSVCGENCAPTTDRFNQNGL
jgi:glyoxylase-like metal-dependent hydrolase (beta-lactamase superfamily II)